MWRRMAPIWDATEEIFFFIPLSGRLPIPLQWISEKIRSCFLLDQNESLIFLTADVDSGIGPVFSVRAGSVSEIADKVKLSSNLEKGGYASICGQKRNGNKGRPINIYHVDLKLKTQ